MTQPRQYWIRKGTNDFSYETPNESRPGENIRSLAHGDQFYDAVVETPIDGGVHVVEYAAVRDLLRRIRAQLDCAPQYRAVQDAIGLIDEVLK